MNKDGHPAWRFIISDNDAEDRTGRSSVRRLTRPPHATASGDHPSTVTKAHPKHTEHRPGNHGKAEGGADSPSFVLNGDPAEDTAEPSSSSSTAPSGTMAEVGVWRRGHRPPLGLTAGVFLCRRAVRRHRAEDYSALSGNDLMLSALTRGGWGLRRKELYDVFGEKNEDEDEEEGDEHRASARDPLARQGGR
ncbi:hypothetical protein EDB84DRAFT_1541210, partial [Lactarius hengduanensis]